MKSSAILIGCLTLYLLCSCTMSPASSSRIGRTTFDQNDLPPISKDGACYAMSVIGNKSEKSSQLLAVYTGNENTENVDV